MLFLNIAPHLVKYYGLKIATIWSMYCD